MGSILEEKTLGEICRTQRLFAIKMGHRFLLSVYVENTIKKISEEEISLWNGDYSNRDFCCVFF